MSTKRSIANINNEQTYNVKAGINPAFIFVHRSSKQTMKEQIIYLIQSLSVICYLHNRFWILLVFTLCFLLVFWFLRKRSVNHLTPPPTFGV